MALEQRALPSAVIYTDELTSTQRARREGMQHHRIHHAEQVHVSGDVHTQTIEGFWSMVKNGLRGIYHSVSAKHLQGESRRLAG